MRRAAMTVLFIGGLMSFVAGLAGAQARKPDATLTLSEGTGGVGIGFSWGKGTLRYRRKGGSGEVGGRSGGAVGSPRAPGTGNVYGLKKPEDLGGNYTGAGAEAAVGGGAGVTVMKNQNGVVIELKSTTQGANLKLAAE